MSMSSAQIAPSAAPYRPAEAGWDLGFVLAAIAVFLSPMNYLRAPGIYFTASDIATLFGLGVMMYQGQITRRPFGGATFLWQLGFLLLGGGLVIGSIAQGSASELAQILFQYAFSLILLPLLLTGRSLAQTVTLLRVWMHAMVVVMLIGIFLIHFTDVGEPFVSPTGRLQSLIERENECAALGAMATALMLGLVQAGRLRPLEIAITFPALIYGILMTGSNTGLGCLVLGVALMAVLTLSARLIGMIAVAGLILVGLALFDGGSLLPEIFRERVLNAIIAGDIEQSGTFSGRLLLIQDALDMADQNYLIGLGAGQFGLVSAHGAAVHNSYLLLLNEGGLLSLMGMMLLIITGLPGGFARLAARRTRIFGAISLTILVIYALMLNTFPHFYARFWNVPLILGLALTVAPSRGRGADYTDPDDWSADGPQDWKDLE